MIWRRIARKHLTGEALGHTLQPTALVNEAYLRLVGRRSVLWQSRAQFLGFLAELMRRILVDHARSRRTAKRGGGAMTVVFDDALGAPAALQPDLVAVDDAIEDLAKLDPRLARIVAMCFFAGLKVHEIADVLGVSTKTIQREWKVARYGCSASCNPMDHRRPRGTETMTPELWQQIKTVLEEALACPASERRDYLQRACGSTEVRREVASLIDLDPRLGNFLEEPARIVFPVDPSGETPSLSELPTNEREDLEIQSAQTIAVSPPNLRPADSEESAGRRMGAYRLLRLLRQGGMGAVYLAERDDAYCQQVAIKVIRGGLASD